MVTGFGAKVNVCRPYFDRIAQHMPFAPFRTQSLRHPPGVAGAAAVQFAPEKLFRSA